MAVTRFEDLDLSRQYTFADYLTWRFGDRVELVRGWVATKQWGRGPAAESAPRRARTTSA